MALNYFDVVVLVRVVYLDLHLIVSICLKPIMDHFCIIVIVWTAELLNSFLDLKLGHLQRYEQSGNYSLFVEQLALPFVER
jgi:hypothetical protein